MPALEITNNCYVCKFWGWNATYTTTQDCMRVRPRPSPAVIRPCFKHAPVTVSKLGTPLWPRVANGHFCGDHERDVRLYGELS